MKSSVFAVYVAEHFESAVNTPGCIVSFLDGTFRARLDPSFGAHRFFSSRAALSVTSRRFWLNCIFPLKEQLTTQQQKMIDVQKERDSLARQIAQSVPQDYAALSKELNAAREHMIERDEEIAGK